LRGRNIGAQARLKLPQSISVYVDSRNLTNWHCVSDVTTIIDARDVTGGAFAEDGLVADDCLLSPGAVAFPRRFTDKPPCRFRSCNAASAAPGAPSGRSDRVWAEASAAWRASAAWGQSARGAPPERSAQEARREDGLAPAHAAGPHSPAAEFFSRAEVAALGQG
jgi:hypothetical protein